MDQELQKEKNKQENKTLSTDQNRVHIATIQIKREKKMFVPVLKTKKKTKIIIKNIVSTHSHVT